MNHKQKIMISTDFIISSPLSSGMVGFHTDRTL